MKHNNLVTRTVRAGLLSMVLVLAPSVSGTHESSTAVAASTTAGPQYTMALTLSDLAQQTTIAFDGLGFLTGSLGSDSFIPPGKVSDYFGFQYLRDNDPSAMGHNTDFLTKASLNMLTLLTPSQRMRLVALANDEVRTINEYGYKRFVLMTAFRRLLAGGLPTGSTGLDEAAVQGYSAELYRIDGQMSYGRAKVYASLLRSLSSAQRASLDAMVGKGMTSWPTASEPPELRPLRGDAKVAVMSYAGDMFSWYAGSIDADVYFCPERQGTYFGSFYLKDAPAVGNPNYSIGTNITNNMGKALVAALTPTQAQLVTSLVSLEHGDLLKIVDTRRAIATQLRQFLAGRTPDSASVLSLSDLYGRLDGQIVYDLATHFAQVGQTLTSAQHTTLMALRKQTVGNFTPSGAFLYSTPISMPTVPSTDFLFGVGTETAWPAPQPWTIPATPQPAGPQRGGIGGKVTAVSGMTIVIANPQGKTTTVVTSSSTDFTANGRASNLAQVAPGKSIQVTGQPQTDGSWLATAVEITDRPPAPPGQKQPPPGMAAHNP